MTEGFSVATQRDLALGGSPPLGATITLRVVRGPAAGRTLTLDDTAPNRIHIGRSPTCELPIEDGNASRRHVALEIVGGRLLLTDLDSTNGTRLDGVRVLSAPIDPGQVIAIGESEIRVEADSRAPGALPERTSFGRIVGASREMRRMYLLCERLARGQSPVLIEGETGTGKEVLAESLFVEGPRSKAPFIVFDCTTVTPQLVESELFGHERGAFTGADRTRIGLLEAADGGTLFIDEIGDLDLTMQPKLLRAIERKEFRRVGGTKTMTSDARLLFATRRDLDKEVQAGRFRDDLYHRITVTRVMLPPLRRRQGDVPLLVETFARQLNASSADIPGELLRRWERQPWPGNVRELRNAVARHLDLGDLASFGDDERALAGVAVSPAAEAPGLAQFVEGLLARNVNLAAARGQIVEAFEREYLIQILRRHGNSAGAAAAASGIAHRHFNRLLAKLRGG